jgi:hydroxymethylglutaryl-CoA lyase
MVPNIVLHEVGLRDGLQMEHQVVPLETKLRWIEQLVAANVPVIQVGSFVHPTKVSQMADTDQLFREIETRKIGKPETVFSALVLNEKGLERAQAAHVQMLCMGVSASETHSRKNTGMSIAEATERMIATAHAAENAGMKVQLSVQSAFGCGFEGPVPRDRVLSIAEKFMDAGFTTISLADTAGHAMPDAVERMFDALRLMNPASELACHFHNTYGVGLANCMAALRVGVTCFESSVAGLGGCPFTKIAGGNVCTEDLVHMGQHMGILESVQLKSLVALAQDVQGFFQRELPGTIHRVGSIPEFMPQTA